MDWKNSLDKYLTTEPEDRFTPWCDSVFEKIEDDFLIQNPLFEHWFMHNTIANRILNKSFSSNKSIEKTIAILKKDFLMFELLYRKI